MEFDTDKAGSAHVYDDLIGGTHSFEADRVAQLNRLFLGSAAEQVAQADLQCYIDPATGLPAEGALHEFVPMSAKVSYNDIDREAVGHGRQIVSGWPNIRYIQADVRNIDLVLAVAEDFFGSERRVEMCLIGVAFFIEDEALQHIFQRLHEWAAPRSQLIVSSIGYRVEEAASKQAAERYVQQTGLRYYPRPSGELLRLAEPWQPYQDSIKSLEDHAETHIGTTVTRDPRRGKLGYSGMLIHP